MNPEYHYNNVGQTLAKLPHLIGSFERHGIHEGTTNSQILALKHPNIKVEDYDNIFDIEASKELRWHKNQKLAEMDQDARGLHLDNNDDGFHFMVNAVWSSINDEVKEDVFQSRNMSKTGSKIGDSITKEDVKDYLDEESAFWHLIDNKRHRTLHISGLTQLANFHNLSVAYDKDDSIAKTVRNIYGAFRTGKNDATGSHHGMPTKIANIYGITGNQIVNAAQRAVVETLMRYTVDNVDLKGDEHLTDEMRKYYIEEAFKNRGSLQFDAMLSEDGNRWNIVIREFEEQEAWLDIPNKYLPIHKRGDLLVNGQPVYIEWNEVARMAMSAEIVSGLHQIEETKGNKFSSIWEDLLTHEGEYLGKDGKPPSKRRDKLSGQQFPETDLMKGFILGAPQNFSKAQVDFVIKPMMEHFRSQKHNPHSINIEPPDEEIRAYINKELRKHGDRTTRIAEYFSINRDSFQFLKDTYMHPEKSQSPFF